MSPLRALLVVVAAFVLTVVAVPPGESSGAAQTIGVSRDGERFSPALTEQLFDSSLRWVPGDVREARFWVRNQADQPGDLSIDVVTPDRTGLMDTGQLSVAARVGDGAWQVLEDGTSGRVVTARDVASAEAVPVDVRVALAPGAGQLTQSHTQSRTTDLQFRVVRADARAPAPAQTIGALPWWTPPLGAPLVSLLLAGLLLLILAIRDRHLLGNPT